MSDALCLEHQLSCAQLYPFNILIQTSCLEGCFGLGKFATQLFGQTTSVWLQPLQLCLNEKAWTVGGNCFCGANTALGTDYGRWEACARFLWCSKTALLYTFVTFQLCLRSDKLAVLGSTCEPTFWPGVRGFGFGLGPRVQQNLCSFKSRKSEDSV